MKPEESFRGFPSYYYYFTVNAVFKGSNYAIIKLLRISPSGARTTAKNLLQEIGNRELIIAQICEKKKRKNVVSPDRFN